MVLQVVDGQAEAGPNLSLLSCYAVPQFSTLLCSQKLYAGVWKSRRMPSYMANIMAALGTVRIR